MGITVWSIILILIGVICTIRIVKIASSIRNDIVDNNFDIKYRKMLIYMFFFTMVFIAVISLTLNSVVYFDELNKGILPNWLVIPTGNLEVWIGFFGSLFGAIIGGLITLYVLRTTMKAQSHNTTALIASEEVRNTELIEKQNMPVADLKIVCYTGDDFKIYLSNISNVPLLDCKLIFTGSVESSNKICYYNYHFGNFQRNSKKHIVKYRSASEKEDDSLKFTEIKNIKILYMDILGNRYYQKADFNSEDGISVKIGVISVPCKISSELTKR